jgi:hypothetical protein
MASPSLELQVAIVSRLKATHAVTALIGDRVFDNVPDQANFPYVTVGEGDETSDDVDCVEGFEISLDIDVWSRDVGYPEAKNISDAVRRALKSPALTIPTNALVYFQHRQTRFLRDPDGLTSHAVMTFEAFAEQPNTPQ